jgi:hypothetical protein
MNDDDFPGWQPDKSIQLLEGNGLTQVLVKGKPYMRWRSGDEGGVRLAMVQLYQCGLGTEEDLAEAFGRHVTSLQRYLTALNSSSTALYTFSGAPGSLYVLQSASNLDTPINWQPIFTNVTDSNGGWVFTDTNILSYPALFYRLTLP